MMEIRCATECKANDCGEDISFDYFILIDEISLKNGMILENYGVKISSVDGKEEMLCPNITMSRRQIEALMELLSANFVTPTTLLDVVEDWYFEQEFLA